MDNLSTAKAGFAVLENQHQKADDDQKADEEDDSDGTTDEFQHVDSCHVGRRRQADGPPAAGLK
jgi:hypothetical protein